MERKPIEPTISDDRTSGSKYETEGDKWLAVKLRQTPSSSAAQVPEPDAPPPPPVSAPPSEPQLKPQPLPGPPIVGTASNDSLQDYQLQLMLLNKEHQKRLMMARNEQDSMGGSPGGPSASGTGLPQQHKSARASSSQTRFSSLRAGLPHRMVGEISHDPVFGPPADNPRVDHEDMHVISGEQLGVIAGCLGIPDHAASSLAAMHVYISDLKSRAGVPQQPKEPRPLIIHRVFDDKRGSFRTYLDPPQWVEGETGPMEVLIGSAPITNVQAYVAKHPEVCFIACRNYESIPPANVDDKDWEENFKAKHYSESIIPVESRLATAMIEFNVFFDGEHCSDASLYLDSTDALEEFDNHWLDGQIMITFSSPYLTFYHARGDSLDTFTSTLQGTKQLQFQRVTNYIMREYETEYGIVDGLLARQKITLTYLDYVFKPGLVVVHGKGMDARGYTCSSPLRLSPKSANDAGKVSEKAAEKSGALSESLQQTKEAGKSYTIKAWYWKFNGLFSKATVNLTMDDIATTDRSEKNISDLEVRPLKYVDSETLARLRNRGEWAWKCRKRQMIAYHENSDKKLHHSAGERFMVDMVTYNELHSRDTSGPEDRKGLEYITKPWSLSKGLEGEKNPFGPEAMEADEPPDDTFVYLSPLSTIGFNLKTKKWCDLFIDRFSEVEWNTDAFKSLVLNEKTKRLIQALISNQIEAEMSTDIISGKGNGLIMLLHGGPGTGKTLTAESVAEIAQKPLYPVTCGDIGTEPRAVEMYLESVLHLGKTWGCVVLLDEADVFLEQRSLKDLHRNALVSVFLRVLEYYDGILVLTSNRVGTFDEAFKSRIQLSIHYTSLTLLDRVRVWNNFFTRLEKLNEEGIDFDDLKDNVEQLAQHKMNGREIRNAITTARQSSRWERKQKGASYVLNHRVMEEIIETSRRFDKYLKKLNDGMSQDELAADEGLR